MEYTIADSSNNANRPKVLIVGAGLAGLALGMILQKSDTPYEIIERAPKLRPSVRSMHVLYTLFVGHIICPFNHYIFLYALSQALLFL